MNTLRNILLITFISIASQSLYAQRFPVDMTTNVKSVINTSGNGKCVDVAGGYTFVGNAIVQYDCHNGPNQQFKLKRVPGSLSKFFLTIEMDSSKCVGIPADRTAANPYELLRVEACRDSAGNIARGVTWYLDLNSASQTRFKALLAAADGQQTCIDIPSGVSNNSTWLQLYGCHDGPNQRWISQ